MTSLLFKTYLAPGVKPLYEVAAEIVGEALNVDTSLEVGAAYDGYLDDSGDVSFVCGLPYVAFERQGITPAVPIAAPVLTGERYAGRPIYFSDVIVKADSPFRNFSDLRGGRWAYNDLLSQSGYAVTRNRLIEMGETDGFFAEVIAAGSHAASITGVVSGDFDGAAIDSQVLAIAMDQDLGLATEVRIIDSLGPSTIQPVTASLRLPAKTRDQVGEILAELHLDPRAQQQFRAATVARFVRIDAAAYDDIRAMLNRAIEHDYLEIR